MKKRKLSPTASSRVSPAPSQPPKTRPMTRAQTRAQLQPKPQEFFRLLDLPAEIKKMIYDFAWDTFGGARVVLYGRRIYPVNYPGDCCGRTICTCNKSAHSVFGAAPELWSLAQSCKEIHSDVLPLVYKGVQFSQNPMDCKGCVSARRLETLSKRYRIDFVTAFAIGCAIRRGMAHEFGQLIKAISYGRHLKSLHVLFFIRDVEDVVEEDDIRAELEDLLTTHWQEIQVKCKIVFHCKLRHRSMRRAVNTVYDTTKRMVREAETTRLKRLSEVVSSSNPV